MDKNGFKAVYYNSFEYPSIIKLVNNGNINYKNISSEQQEKIQSLVEGFGGWSNMIDTNATNLNEDTEHTLLTVVEESAGNQYSFYYCWKNYNGPKQITPFLVEFFDSLFN